MARRPNSSNAADSDIDKKERILVGVRLEPRFAKVMKALAEYHDCPMGELIEGVFEGAFQGGNAFADKGKFTAETRNRIQSLKEVYGVDYEVPPLFKPELKSRTK